MPLAPLQARYRQTPWALPGALSPDEENQDRAFNPGNMGSNPDLRPDPEPVEQFPPKPPKEPMPAPPAMEAKAAMPPPGSEELGPESGPEAATHDKPEKPHAEPAPVDDSEAAAAAEATPSKPQNPRDAALANTKRYSTPTEQHSNWAQRLGMAVLSATKLAPYANQIVHPKWSEQERARKANLAGAEQELKDVGATELGAAQTRHANAGAALEEEQAATLQREGKRAPKANYITVPGGGLFDAENKEWVKQPVDKSQLTPISREEAEANGIQPLADGTYAIPNTAVGQLLASHKDKAATVHVLPDGSVISYTPGSDTAHVVFKGDPKIDTDLTMLQIGGKPHQVIVDKRTGEMIKDLGESGIKPPVVNVNTEHRKDLAAGLKAYTPALESAERFNVMTKNYEDAMKTHDQQAMLSLLANHLGMTMGLQKGSRLTKDIIHEAENSRPWLQGLAAKFDHNGYLSGVNLTPEQMRQMVNLGRERFAEDMTKGRSEAEWMEVDGTGPKRTPSKATMNHYLGLTGGDPTKAKALAATDGWSVQ